MSFLLFENLRIKTHDIIGIQNSSKKVLGKIFLVLLKRLRFYSCYGGLKTHGGQRWQYSGDINFFLFFFLFSSLK